MYVQVSFISVKHSDSLLKKGYLSQNTPAFMSRFLHWLSAELYLFRIF